MKKKIFKLLFKWMAILLGTIFLLELSFYLISAANYLANIGGFMGLTTIMGFYVCIIIGFLKKENEKEND